MHTSDYNISSMASEFKNLMSKHSISALIVGYPYEMHEENQSDSQVTYFANALSKMRILEDVLYTSWNKSFTTRYTKLLLDPYTFEQGEDKIIRHKFAAVQIPQGYLDFMNENLRQSNVNEHSSHGL